LIAAQDGGFLGGSVGANHGEKLARLFERSLECRAPVVLILASGGVRLHEANAAELALARALRALLAARAAGIPTIAIVAGSCFGGASVLACACALRWMLPQATLGLSGPRVIELERGKRELDADDPAAIATIFGAQSRATAGVMQLCGDSIDAVRATLIGATRVAPDFDLPTLRNERTALRARAAADIGIGDGGDRPASPLFAVAEPVSAAGWLWRLRGRAVYLLRPAGGQPVGTGVALALSGAMLDFIERNARAPATLIIVEDSRGHELSRRAEAACLSQYLAHHAAALALARQRGHRIIGLLAGVGHSAAFFANALQAETLYALSTARVVAMEPAAIARVMRLSQERVTALTEDDPLLGQPVRQLVALGGVAAVWDRVDTNTLLDAVERGPAS
jgi:biotin-independent malonate decarboxylase beta subunit